MTQSGKITSALIIANGTLPPPAVMRRLIASAGMVICADGGANQARRRNIRPDVIIGDFDSVVPATRKFFHSVPQIHISDQETTDLEKALLWCIGSDIPDIIITGASGDRIDHVTGALGCFRKYAGLAAIRFVDSLCQIVPVGRRLSMNVQRGTKISLIPVGACTGISTTGLRYPLRGETLELGVREGISNAASGKRVTVKVESGTLLLCIFFRKRV
jgi:thiamine pyrophosphokinase